MPGVLPQSSLQKPGPPAGLLYFVTSGRYGILASSR